MEVLIENIPTHSPEISSLILTRKGWAVDTEHGLCITLETEKYPVQFRDAVC